MSQNSDDSSDNKKGKRRKKKFSLKEKCSVQLLRRRFPIMVWLPTYTWNFSIFDLIAGLTVGLTVIPQSMAYAAVAGLPFEVCTEAFIWPF